MRSGQAYDCSSVQLATRQDSQAWISQGTSPMSPRTHSRATLATRARSGISSKFALVRQRVHAKIGADRGCRCKNDLATPRQRRIRICWWPTFAHSLTKGQVHGFVGTFAARSELRAMLVPDLHRTGDLNSEGGILQDFRLDAGRASRGRASRGRASRGRASRGRASRGRASRGRASRGCHPHQRTAGVVSRRS
jgi:hypothetical protein